MNIKLIVIIILFILISLFILFNKQSKEQFQNNQYAPFISYENELSSGIQNIEYKYIKGPIGPKGDPGQNATDQNIITYLDSVYNYQEPTTTIPPTTLPPTTTTIPPTTLPPTTTTIPPTTTQPRQPTTIPPAVVSAISQAFKSVSSIFSNYQIFTLNGSWWNNAYAYYDLPLGKTWLSNPAPIALDVDNTKLNIKITGFAKQNKKLEVSHLWGHAINNLKVKVFHS